MIGEIDATPSKFAFVCLPQIQTGVGVRAIVAGFVWL